MPFGRHIVSQWIDLLKPVWAKARVVFGELGLQSPCNVAAEIPKLPSIEADTGGAASVAVMPPASADS